MSNEEDLQKKFQEYQAIAKETKNVDIASLMIRDLENSNKNLLSAGQRRWGYLISVGVPPFGLIFALIFYASGKDDGKRAAYICIALTIFSLVLGYIVIRLMFSSAGVSVDQLQQAPQQLRQLLQN